PLAPAGAVGPPLGPPGPPRPPLGDPPPFRRERELLAVADFDVAAAGHTMHGLGNRRRRNRHVLGEPRADDRLAAASEIVNSGEVVLRGGGRGRDSRSTRP